MHPDTCSNKPFYKLSEVVSHNVTEANASNEKMQAFDADERVLVIIGHDTTVKDCVPFFPDTLNDWKEAGLKQKCRWEFIRDFELDEKKVKAEKGGREG